jgi:glucose-1-phosphate thymidylyltransferase
MDCIVLAGGFARRLLPLTENTPKPLLPVGGRPILSYTIDRLRNLPGLGTVYITTNRRFSVHFQDYIRAECADLRCELFIEDAESEGQKLGSVGALHHIVRKTGLKGDCLVIGGDNLFDFPLPDLVAIHERHNASVVALHDVGSLEKASLYGIARLAPDGRMTELLEKPARPPSTLASTACYLFSAEAMGSLERYIREGNPPDAAGHFVAWLCKHFPVYGYPFKGLWFDIGSKESYAEADELFWSRRGGRPKTL